MAEKTDKSSRQSERKNVLSLIWLTAAGFLVGVAFAVIVAYVLFPNTKHQPREERQTKVTKSNMERIQIGMTKAEVEAIFEEPGEVAVERDCKRDENSAREKAGLSRYFWWCDPPNAAIGIQFDRNEKVANISWGKYYP